MLDWKGVLEIADKGNPAPPRRVEKSDEEWRNQLTDEQYRITRKKGTERKFTGEHCSTYEPGIYTCVCCDSELFDSSIKYDSGSGWPAFSEAINDTAIKYDVDKSLFMKRVEVLCNVCDAHLGHVFRDGPKPSGLRYCVNSESIKFKNNGK